MGVRIAVLEDNGVRAIRKLPDGSTASTRGREVGDVLDLPSLEAGILVAKEWAAPERRAPTRGNRPAWSHDRCCRRSEERGISRRSGVCRRSPSRPSNTHPSRRRSASICRCRESASSSVSGACSLRCIPGPSTSNLRPVRSSRTEWVPLTKSQAFATATLLHGWDGTQVYAAFPVDLATRA